MNQEAESDPVARLLADTLNTELPSDVEARMCERLDLLRSKMEVPRVQLDHRKSRRRLVGASAIAILSAMALLAVMLFPVGSSRAIAQVAEKIAAGLREVSGDFSSPLRLHRNFLTGGGVIDRIDGSVITINTGDEVALADSTLIMIPADKPGMEIKAATRADLQPGTPIAYEIQMEKSFKAHRIFIVGKRLELTAAQKEHARIMKIVESKKLKELNRFSTSFDTQKPLRTPGIDGPVTIMPGEIKLVELKEATLITTIGWADMQEKIGDEESFRFLLVEWLKNGNCNVTFYAEK
jgi:hypothetical protein